jgi:hypothetical protein
MKFGMDAYVTDFKLAGEPFDFESKGLSVADAFFIGT